MDCKYIKYTCKMYKSIGHLAKMCNKNKNHFINVEESLKLREL